MSSGFAIVEELETMLCEVLNVGSRRDVRGRLYVGARFDIYEKALP